MSEGCRNCYAERMALRLRAMGKPNYARGFALTTHPHLLQEPLKWTRPQVVFVNSMSDLFHENVPVDFIQEVFRTMSRTQHHIFQVLTKRSHRLLELSSILPWPENVWMGVTVEHPDYIFRIKHLKESGAKTRFVSFEPLLAPIADLDLSDIDWAIVGGESGPKARPMSGEWVRHIRDQCIQMQVPFFFKQWGGINKKKAGKELDGRTWTEMPSKWCAVPSKTQDSLF